MKLLCVSLGCDKNLVDSERMLGRLTSDGWEITDDEREADAVLVNTCAFIDSAKEESIGAILDAAKLKENGRCRALIVSGCMAERYQEEVLREIPEVDAVVGTASGRTVSFVIRRVLGGESHITDFEPLAETPEAMEEEEDAGRVLTTLGGYSFLKIAEGCNNRLLANSGLFSIEQGIEEFATKYSVYNKCYQSESLLHEIIERTDVRLDEAYATLESSRKILADDLNGSKADLLDQLFELSESLCDAAREGYLPSMNEWAKQSVPAAGLTSEKLRDWEREITVAKRREMGAEQKKRDAEGKKAAIATNLRARVQNAWDTRDVLGIAGIAKTFASDWNAAREAEEASEEIFRGADREASDSLLTRVRVEFDEEIERLMQEAEDHSKAYWEDCAEASRKALLELVSNGANIDAERRESLRSIIVDYRRLSLDDEIPEIYDIRYPFNPNKLWKAPLRVQYKIELTQRISKWRSIVESAHKESFQEWLHELTDALSNSVVDLNPELRKKFDSVVNIEREIEAQKSKKLRLRSGEKRVSGYMSWQEA